MIDLSSIPLVALSMQTKELISALVNPRKYLPTENDMLRDWRGLAHISGISGELMPSLVQHPDPFGHILDIMQKKSNKYTLKDLQNMLDEIERWDILEDSAHLIVIDNEPNYKRRKVIEMLHIIQNKNAINEFSDVENLSTIYKGLLS